MTKIQKMQKPRTKKEPANGLLKLEEVCQYLHVTKSTLRKWSDQGLIKTYRIGPGFQRRFKREDIAEFLVEQPVKPQADISRLRKFPKQAKLGLNH